MSLPHVLVVSNYFEVQKHSPAAGIFVDRQIASLERAGVKISTFDIGNSHSPLRLLYKWIQLRRRVRQVSPDLVHGQYGTIVGLLTAFAGRPAVISFCGGDLQPGASVSSLRLTLGFLLSNLAALRADRLICKSEQLRQALWWRKSKAIVIPSGVDLTLFSPGQQNEARKELGWDQETPVAILNVGDDPKGKGIDLAQAAMKVAQVLVPNAELHIISKVDPLRVPLYFRAADVLVCTSITEGSPNVVKEALACNLPVVSTPVGDVRERLVGVYPSSVVSRDPQEFGEALAKIMLSRERSNGRARIVDLGLDQVARQILSVYQSVLSVRDTGRV
jgi:teichuronic acid biosynthesis glycosyltransferase TuaC